MLEKTDGAITKLVERLQEAGFDQAQQFIDAAIRAAHVDGLVTIWGAVFVGLFFVGALIICAIALYRGSDDVALGALVIAASSALVLVFMLVASDVWLKLFDPEASVYRGILKLMLKGK